MEQYFISASLLSPIYHPRYWVNLNKTSTTWSWADGATPGPGPLSAYGLSTYTHWGTYTDPFDSSISSPEPDGTGSCATADFLQAFDVASSSYGVLHQAALPVQDDAL